MMCRSQELNSSANHLQMLPLSRTEVVDGITLALKLLLLSLLIIVPVLVFVFSSLSRFIFDFTFHINEEC